MRAKKKARPEFLTNLELQIQKTAFLKDKNFILSGKWKKFIGEAGGFKIYVVNGEWVRINLSALFGHGGHGYVHEFIPLNEIWVDTRHHDGCGCENLKSKNQKVSPQFFASTAIHEITEFKEMEKGIPFYIAHQTSLEKEKELGLLENPFLEVE